MKPSSRTNALTIALYFNGCVLLVLVAVLLSRPGSPSLVPAAMAQQPAMAGGDGLYLMPAQFSVNTWGCYLLDADAQTLMAYQFYPGEKQLRFVAARDFRYDRRVGNYNTTPSPEEVKRLVDQEQAGNRFVRPRPPATQPQTPSEPEQPQP